VDAPEPWKTQLETLPRIHVSIALDENLNLDQPTVDHCPRLTIARWNHLGDGDTTVSEFTPNQLNGIQPGRADVRPVHASNAAPTAGSDKQIQVRGPAKIPSLLYTVEAVAFA
jgi:hypothetical protein